jgi:ABC-type sugar transport system ATPase subunit
VRGRSAHIELRGIAKRFGGVQALLDVDLTISRGAIHALVGENGAGKSTLGKLIAGVHQADAGELCVDGRPVSYRSPHDALKHGLTMMAQEISLVPGRSVIENVFLGRESHRGGVTKARALRARYDELSDRAGFKLPAAAPVDSLRLADQQKVEILRALARNAELIVMDEPTAALTADEGEKLFEIVRALRARGTTIVYVSHFLGEVLSLVDTITVLKDGRLVRTSRVGEETEQTLVTAMLGRSLDVAFPEKAYPAADAPVVLSVNGLSRKGTVDNVSFEVRAGEIVGLAGLVGSGRSEVARAIFGADRADAGEVRLMGKRLDVSSPRDAIRAGVVLLPESRKEQGLVMGRPVFENVTLPNLRSVSVGPVVHARREKATVASIMQRLGVAISRAGSPVGDLSGGNQQKVMFAKWLLRTPKVLIADEPTRGVDVGAKRSIYELLQSLAREGTAVIVISSEHEEVLGLAHRVLVMRGGRVAAAFDARDVTERAVLRAALRPGDPAVAA